MGLSISGAQAGDYVLSSNTTSGTVGTITPATLTAGLTGTVDKTYDGTTTATLSSSNYVLPGVYSGDTVTLNDPTSGTYDNANAGYGKTVTVSGLAISGGSAGDYILASTTVSGPVGEIDPAMVSGSLTPYLGGTVTKVYDGTITVDNLTSANYMLSGVMNGDSVTLTGPTTGTYASKDVGTGILVTSSTGLVLSGPQAGNYSLDSTTASGNIGIITPASLTADLTGTVSKTYDSTTAATLGSANYGLSGVFSGDTVTVTGPTSGTYAGKDVATGITVTSASGLSLGGAQAGDYVLSNTTANGAVGVITPATLTASLTGTTSKVYNSTTAATLTSGNYNLAGVYNGDTVSLNDPTSGTYDTKDVGTGKTITVMGLAISGAQAGDYTLGSSTTNGTIGAITPASLTADLTGTVSKTYDSTTAATLSSADYDLSGVFSGDAVTVTGPTSGTYAGKDVATGITVTSASGLSLGGAQAGDYTLSNTTATGAVGTITPATLTASLAGTTSKVYNSTTAATLTSGNYNLGGVYSGDTVALNDPTSGTYDSKDVATGKTVTATGLALSGAQAGDYVLGSSTTSGTIGTITPATLTASLTGTVSKVYDGTTGGTLNPANVSLSTVYSGDSVGATGTESFSGKNAGTNQSVTISGLSLTGADAIDYQLSTTSLSSNTATITAAPLTIAANSFMITPGSALPDFTASYAGFVPGESPSVLTGTLVFQTPATSESPDGNYAITPSGVSDPNYQIQFVAGNLDIANPPAMTTPPTVIVTDPGGGSNKFPPGVTPQPIQTGIPPPPTGNSGPAPVNYTGVGIASQTGQQGPGLADSTGNSGQVGSGDSAQLGNGELNNASNPAANGALNEALGPAVHTALIDALKDAGDFTTDYDAGSQNDEDVAAKNAKHRASDETTLNGGDVVSIGSDGVQNIPLNKAPQPLRDALAGDVLHGMPAGTGH